MLLISHTKIHWGGESWPSSIFLRSIGMTTKPCVFWWSTSRGGAPRATLYYSGAYFERLGGGGDNEADANRFTSDDLVAITMLGVHVRGHGAVDLLTDPDGHWARLLSAIPRSARLEDPDSAPLVAEGGQHGSCGNVSVMPRSTPTSRTESGRSSRESYLPASAPD